MDSLSIKILKELNKSNKPVTYEQLTFLYGAHAPRSIAFLTSEKYITEGTKYGGISRDPATGRVATVNVPNGKYEISAIGKDFLQHLVLNEFDKWITRIAAFVGAITGIISLVLHFT